MKTSEEIYLQVEGHFDAAHNLVNYEGRCANLHGHRWQVLVEVGPFTQEELDDSGLAFDFKDVKRVLNDLLDVYDHSYLNDYFERPSAENIALTLFRALRRDLGDKVKELTVFESPESRCRVTSNDS